MSGPCFLLLRDFEVPCGLARGVFHVCSSSDLLPEEGDVSGSRNVGDETADAPLRVQRLTCHCGRLHHEASGLRPRPTQGPVPRPTGLVLPAAGRSSLPAEHGGSARQWVWRTRPWVWRTRPWPVWSRHASEEPWVPGASSACDVSGSGCDSGRGLRASAAPQGVHPDRHRLIGRLQPLPAWTPRGMQQPSDALLSVSSQFSPS